MRESGQGDLISRSTTLSVVLLQFSIVYDGISRLIALDYNCSGISLAYGRTNVSGVSSDEGGEVTNM
jgi:hypothetical protein